MKKISDSKDRMWRLWVTIIKMIRDESRDPEKVAGTLQAILDEKIDEVDVHKRLLFLWAMIQDMVNSRTRDPEKVAETLQTIVNGPFEISESYLRLNTEAEVIPTPAISSGGTLKSGGFFSRGVFGEIPRAGDGRITSATNAVVYDLIKSGRLFKIFGSLKPGSFEWEDQCQVLWICQRFHRELRVNNGSTRSPSLLFPLKESTVVDVHLGADNYFAHVYKLSHQLRWYATGGHRAVISEP